MARRRTKPRRFLLAAALAIVGIVCAAAPAQNDFKFAILGDRTGDAQPGVYEKVWTEIDAFHPDFVINVGDTIQGLNDATTAAEWLSLRPLWDGHKYPTYFTPGNHDIWSAESRRVFEQQTGRPAFYSFDYQNAHFIVLDNSRDPDLSTSLSDQQMQFLTRDLAANSARDPKFVFFHKPFWLIPAKFQNSHFAFQAVMKTYGVQYVFSGHGHQYVRAALDGVNYIEVPSSGGKLKGQGAAQGWFYGYMQVTVKGPKVDLTVQKSD